MSDRTWNRIDGRLWDEDWSLCALVVMAILISRCPNAYGIYKLPLGVIKRTLAEKFTAVEVAEAIRFLALDGTIKLYRQDTIVWLVNKFARESSLLPANSMHMKYLRSELAKYPEVRDEFLSLYNPHRIGIESLSDSDTYDDTIPIPITDSDSDSDSDTDTEIKKKIKLHSGESADWLEFAKQVIKLIEQRAKAEDVTISKTTNTRLNAAAKTLRLLVERDGVDRNRIIPTLERIWDEYDIGAGFNWATVLMGVASWRDKDGKFIKAYNQAKSPIRNKSTSGNQNPRLISKPDSFAGGEE